MSDVMERLKNALGDEASADHRQGELFEATDEPSVFLIAGMTAEDLDALEGPLDGPGEDPRTPAAGPAVGQILERIAAALERIAETLTRASEVEATRAKTSAPS